MLNNYPIVRRVLKILFWTVTGLSYAFVAYGLTWAFLDTSSLPFCDEDNVLAIPIEGTLVTYDDGTDARIITISKDVVELLEAADADPNIEFIILEIDSGGGSVVATEEILRALQDIETPVASLIRGQALSAAFWLAISTDKVFAHSTSDLGSLAVNASYLDYSEQNAEEGIRFQDLTTGRYKNILDPDKPLTEEERNMALEWLQFSHDFMVKTIAEVRELEAKEVEAVADGRILTSQQAMDAGLIDKIGNRQTILEDFFADSDLDYTVCES